MNDSTSGSRRDSQTPDAERELECLVAIGAVAGRVAHEINNPLASIQNAFLLLKDAIPPSHPHYAYVAAIQREIQRIATVTRTLAETYRPEQDRATGVAVSSIVAEAVRLADQSGGLPIALENPVHAPVAAPAGLLRHGLSQVLEDAARLSRSDEPIRIDVRAVTDGVAIRVRYRARAITGTPPEKYPHRIMAALGGSIELAEPEPGWQAVILHLPMNTRPETIA